MSMRKLCEAVTASANGDDYEVAIEALEYMLGMEPGEPLTSEAVAVIASALRDEWERGYAEGLDDGMCK